jgi:ribonuclease E
MLDTEPTGDSANTADASNQTTSDTASGAPRRRRSASRPAGPPVAAEHSASDAPSAEAPPAKKATRKRAAKKVAAPAETSAEHSASDAPSVEAPAKKTARKRATKKAAAADAGQDPGQAQDTVTSDARPSAAAKRAAAAAAPGLLFQPPEPVTAARRRRTAAAEGAGTGSAEGADASDGTAQGGETGPDDAAGEGGEGGTARRRRRGGRGRRGRGGRDDSDEAQTSERQTGRETADRDDAAEDQAPGDGPQGEPGSEESDGEGGTRRRRRRRRRGGSDDGSEDAPVDDPPNTVTRVREPRKSTRPARDRDRDDDDGVRSVKGSTRLEAKKQRRREGREAGRRRPSIVTEAEFLARRESVEREMIVRQSGDRTQIAVLEDGVLVEHYVSLTSGAGGSGLVGNVYLGRVQNVLPSMEAAFIDIGKGRNAVLYAGEVNWDAAGLEGQPRRIELALKSGDPVLAQVTKDPIGHKGARLSSQVSLAGRYLVLVPGNSMTGISRKLPDTERARLKSILKKVVPEGSGVIVRTAAEGASEDELSRDVARLTAQWEDIEKKSTKGSTAPTLLYGEPDMTIRVVRDIFNEDFRSLVVSGDDAWDMLEPYVSHVAPDLRDRMSRWTGEQDVFTEHRVDEQLAKALDRKVWLPSGGYLVIDRTEAMVVVDVNTGKFTGAGGNLEETVTKNNLEAAEEIVRQLRLRDLGGIIVIDFIDMVLESNRDLVLRRLLECLGRDRTKHQVAEVTSLGLVQMTRKRVGQGLHEVFAETCEACNGRGYHIHTEPVEKKNGSTEVAERKSGGRGGRGKQAAGPAAAAVAAASGGKSGRRSRAGAASDAESGKAADAAPEETGDFDELDASPVTEDDRTGPTVGDEDLEVSVLDVGGDGAAAVDAAPETEAEVGASGAAGGGRTRRRRVASSPVTTL